MRGWQVVLWWVALCARAAAGDRYHGAAGAEGAGAARVAAAELGASHWADEARAAIEERLRRRAAGAARNVVMFMGDGMSVPTLAAARTLLGQRRGDAGEEARLAFETFPTAGLVKTYCVNQQVADSACTATAYLCGAKTNAFMLGVTARVTQGDCTASSEPSNHVQSIAEWALAEGRDAGFVTTTRVTHASPGGLFAKVADRDWESDADVTAAGYDVQFCPDITHQLVHLNPGRQFKVILGGGRRNFLPNDILDEEGTQGRRTDGRNLIEEWQQDKAARNVSHQYVWNREQLMDAAQELPEYLLGMFEGTHMQYHMQGDPTTEPTLAELTEVAIRSLSRNENGFFLFVEGGRIDHAHHDNYVELALDETIEMDLAVQRAMELLSEEDSLIVVTADHAHVMAFNGYTPRGGDILGPANMRDRDGVRFMTLSYTNGPGARLPIDGVRVDPTTDDNYRELTWRSHADVPLGSETHGGDDVPVFAWGPHHDMFTGLYEQSQLPFLMAYAACIGPGLRACDVTEPVTAAPETSAVPSTPVALEPTPSAASTHRLSFVMSLTISLASCLLTFRHHQ